MKVLQRSLVSIALLLLAAALYAQPSFTIGDLTGAQGSTINMPVCLNNEGLDVVSFDVKIILPNGATVATNDKGTCITDLSSRKVDHVITCNSVSSGGYKYISYSNTNNVYEGSEGVMFTSPIELDLEPGVYEITITGGSVAVLSGDGSLNSCACENTTATLTVTEPLVVEDHQFYAYDLILDAGTEETTLDICLKNSEELYDLKLDMTLPEGITVKLSGRGANKYPTVTKGVTTQVGVSPY